MHETSCCHSVTISATNKKRLDERLDQAVSHAIEKALKERRRGILVTQDAPDRFIVALSEEVPFGITKECRTWGRDDEAPGHSGDGQQRRNEA